MKALRVQWAIYRKFGTMRYLAQWVNYLTRRYR